MATGGAPAATSTVTQEPVVWHPDHASQTPSSVSSPKASRRTSSVASKGTLLHPAATGRKAVEELAAPQLGEAPPSPTPAPVENAPPLRTYTKSLPPWRPPRPAEPTTASGGASSTPSSAAALPTLKLVQPRDEPTVKLDKKHVLGGRPNTAVGLLPTSRRSSELFQVAEDEVPSTISPAPSGAFQPHADRLGLPSATYGTLNLSGMHGLAPVRAGSNNWAHAQSFRPRATRRSLTQMKNAATAERKRSLYQASLRRPWVETGDGPPGSLVGGLSTDQLLASSLGGLHTNQTPLSRQGSWDETLSTSIGAQPFVTRSVSSADLLLFRAGSSDPAYARVNHAMHYGTQRVSLLSATPCMCARAAATEPSDDPYSTATGWDLSPSFASEVSTTRIPGLKPAPDTRHALAGRPAAPPQRSPVLRSAVQPRLARLEVQA